MIICKNLSKNFGKIIAIKDFSLNIPDSQIFGLLGPNGAGKTTIMRILATLISATTGEASIDEYKVGKNFDNQKIRGMIGLLPEVPGLYETLGAYKNLDYFAQFYGVSKNKRENSIKDILTNLDLWNRRNEPVGGFSKGMKQKIAIARALIHEPKYIFLDEPTASLDPEAAKTVRDYIVELKSEGRTIMINTHNLDEAERICDKVALVKNRLIKVGNPRELAKGLFTRTISITLGQITDSLVNDISKLEFVSKVRAEKNKIFLNINNPETDNNKIIQWLINKGMNVQFLSEEEHRLEDVYIKLIGEAK